MSFASVPMASAEYSLARARMLVQGFPLPFPLRCPFTGCIGGLPRIRVGSSIAPLATLLRLRPRGSASPGLPNDFFVFIRFRFRGHNVNGHMSHKPTSIRPWPKLYLAVLGTQQDACPWKDASTWGWHGSPFSWRAWGSLRAAAARATTPPHPCRATGAAVTPL